MTYLVFFNELCLHEDDEERLAKPVSEALEWLSQFVDLMVVLSTRYRVKSLRASREVMKQIIVHEFTLGRLLSHRGSLVQRDKLVRFRFLLDRAPIWLDELPVQDEEGIFTTEQTGHIYMYETWIARGLGAAALTDGVCVSFATNTCWKCTSVPLTQTSDSGDESICATHFYHVDNLSKRIFEHNTKHKPTASDDAYASAMPFDPIKDLSKIQELLNKGVQPAEMDEIFCLFGEKFLIFRPHKPGYFHGYQVSQLHSSYKAHVLKAFLDAGLLEKKDYEKLIH